MFTPAVSIWVYLVPDGNLIDVLIDVVEDLIALLKEKLPLVLKQGNRKLAHPNDRDSAIVGDLEGHLRATEVRPLAQRLVLHLKALHLTAQLVNVLNLGGHDIE